MPQWQHLYHFPETLNAIGVVIVDGTEKTFEFELFNAL